MTLFHQTGEEMIRARHMIALFSSASQAITENLEVVQELCIWARPTTDGP